MDFSKFLVLCWPGAELKLRLLAHRWPVQGRKLFPKLPMFRINEKLSLSRDFKAHDELFKLTKSFELPEQNKNLDQMQNIQHIKRVKHGLFL